MALIHSKLKVARDEIIGKNQIEIGSDVDRPRSPAPLFYRFILFQVNFYCFLNLIGYRPSGAGISF